MSDSAARQLLAELAGEYEAERHGERAAPWGVFFQDFCARARGLDDPPLAGALPRLLAEMTRTLGGYERDVDGARRTAEELLRIRGL